MAEHTFKRGDVVKLKSNGTVMTVSHEGGDTYSEGVSIATLWYTCFWTHDGLRQEDTYYVDQLEPATSVFKIGDVVTLKSGGVRMTVRQVVEHGSTPTVCCVWYTRLRGFEERAFAPHVLKPAVNLEKPDSTDRLWYEQPC